MYHYQIEIYVVIQSQNLMKLKIALPRLERKNLIQPLNIEIFLNSVRFCKYKYITIQIQKLSYLFQPVINFPLQGNIEKHYRSIL